MNMFPFVGFLHPIFHFLRISLLHVPLSNVEGVYRENVAYSKVLQTRGSLQAKSLVVIDPTPTKPGNALG